MVIQSQNIIFYENIYNNLNNPRFNEKNFHIFLNLKIPTPSRANGGGDLNLICVLNQLQLRHGADVDGIETGATISIAADAWCNFGYDQQGSAACKRVEKTFISNVRQIHSRHRQIATQQGLCFK